MGVETLTPRMAKMLRPLQHPCHHYYWRRASELLDDPEFCVQVRAMLQDIDVGSTPEVWRWLLQEDTDFLLKLALHSRETSYVVQAFIQAANSSTSAKLASKLAPHTVALSESPHGNFVLSAAIEMLPPSKFVEEIKNKGPLAVAKHRFGCRACIQLIRWHSQDLVNGVGDILCVLAAATEKLARHPYGRHIIQALYEHGTEQHRKQVESSLLGLAPGLAVHRQGSWMVQEMLQRSVPDSRLQLARTLVFAAAPSIAEIAARRCGSYVVLELLEQKGKDLPCEEVARELGLELRARLRGAPARSRHFQRVTERLGAMSF